MLIPVSILYACNHAYIKYITYTYISTDIHYACQCILYMYIHTYGAFFRWNQIDLVTVVLGWTGVFLSNRAVNFNVLRIIRVVRLMRAARVVISIPEFYILVAESQLH